MDVLAVLLFYTTGCDSYNCPSLRIVKDYEKKGILYLTVLSHQLSLPELRELGYINL
jgi:hypothetical protein